MDERQRSVRRWQGKDRYYEEVQRAGVTNPNARREAQEVADDLMSLARPLPEDVQVWRGIRSIIGTFGVAPDVLETMVGPPAKVTTRFLSTTVHRHIAEEEFTSPGNSPGLMKVNARAGTPAVWLPPLGDPDLAYQGELLFSPGVGMRILAVVTSVDIPVIEVEVSRP